MKTKTPSGQTLGANHQPEVVIARSAATKQSLIETIIEIASRKTLAMTSNINPRAIIAAL